MNNFDYEGFPGNDWEDRGELRWNEFDWERYLKTQDDAIVQYLAVYDPLAASPGRIDEVARKLGWESTGSWDNAGEARAEEPRSDDAAVADDELAPYTVHRNPAFVATRALAASTAFFAGKAAQDPALFPAQNAVAFLQELQAAEVSAVLAIQDLDFGDYALGISLFKRALASLNRALGALQPAGSAGNRQFAEFRDYALPRLFDLREIWLRVMNECRDELERPFDDDTEDDEDDD